MNYFDKEKPHKIDNLEKKLYSKNIKQEDDIRSEFDDRKIPELDDDWNPENHIGDAMNPNSNANNHTGSNQYTETPYDIQPPKTGIFWMVLLVAVLFFVGSIGYASYVFLGGQKIISTDDVVINIVGPVSIGGGDKLSIDAVFQNNSSVALEEVQLVVDYPKGAKTPDLKQDLTRERFVIGTMGVGSALKQTLNMAFLGENGETKKVDVKLEYRLPNSTALITKSKPFEIVLSEAPVQILVNALERISSGQNIDLDIEIRSNSEKDIEQLVFIADYPFGFTYTNSTLPPTYGNNVWVFNNFKTDDLKKIQISGIIQAQDGENRAFRFNAGLPSEINREEIGIVLSNARHIISLERPFIDLQLAVNGSLDEINSVKSGEQIDTDIIFYNNTNNIVRDIEILMYLNGVVLDKFNVSTRGGYYDSLENKIIYNKTTAPESLVEVLPRQKVEFSSQLKTLSLVTNNLGLKNPELKISAVVRGRRVSETGADEQIEQEDFVNIKVLSDVRIRTSTAHNTTAVNGLIDSGPIPPKVDTDTTYTINWSMTNSTNDLENAKVTALLPVFVSWNNKFYPSTENISYDPVKRIITWVPGNVSAGTGYGNVLPEKVSFQVTLKPGINFFDETVDIVENIVFSATDKFSGKNLTGGTDDNSTIIQGRSTNDFHHKVVD